MKKRLTRIIAIALLFILSTHPEVFAEAAAGIAVTVTVEHEEQIAGVRIQVYPRFRWARPGRRVILRAMIRNRGNGDDYFKLTAFSSLGWEVDFPQGDIIGPIKPRRRKRVRIKVTIPKDAKRGQRNRITITASSQFDPSVSAQDSSAIQVR